MGEGSQNEVFAFQASFLDAEITIARGKRCSQ